LKNFPSLIGGFLYLLYWIQPATVTFFPTSSKESLPHECDFVVQFVAQHLHSKNVLLNVGVNLKILCIVSPGFTVLSAGGSLKIFKLINLFVYIYICFHSYIKRNVRGKQIDNCKSIVMTNKLKLLGNFSTKLFLGSFCFH